jgi:hypothetical protein
MIIKPEDIKHDDIVNISIIQETIECSTIAYNAIFHHIIKSYDFKWSDASRKWIKKVSPEYLRDRTAEIGYVVLLEGFAVSIDDQEIARKIQAGDFQYEPTRVIDICYMDGFENYLKVLWKRADLYACVKYNLYGSKYLRNLRAMVVPLYFYEEIYDFAKDYEFLITEEAKAKIEEGKQNVLVLFNLKTPIKKNETIFHSPPKLELQRGAIDDSLKD